MATRFNLLRKAAATWTSDATVLTLGQVGIETDTRRYKVGNGVTAWASLPYKLAPGNIVACGVTTVTDNTAISCALITLDSLVIVTSQSSSGPVYEIVASRVAGTSFTITSESSQTVAWVVIEPTFEDNAYVEDDGNQTTARTK